MNLFIYFIEPIFMTLLVFCKVRKCFFGDTFINEGQNVSICGCCSWLWYCFESLHLWLEVISTLSVGLKCRLCEQPSLCHIQEKPTAAVGLMSYRSLLRYLDRWTCFADPHYENISAMFQKHYPLIVQKPWLL